MFGSNKALQARINGHTISVEPRETLLLAALRAGLDFPHSCRTGACTSCRCTLLSGKVRTLTDFSYVLSEEELFDNVILACQTVPLTDISVRVDPE